VCGGMIGENEKTQGWGGRIWKRWEGGVKLK